MSLLPHNATSRERAIEAAVSRISNVPIPLRDLWDPDTCPIHLLPWLAWALSVEAWSMDWPSYRKRAVIRSAMQTARKKGTRGAVVGSLAALGASATVREWFEMSPPGDPHTFTVDLVGNTNSVEMQDMMLGEINRTKPLRSHFSINWGVEVEAYLNVCGLLRMGGMQRIAGAANPAISLEAYTDPSGTPYTDPSGNPYTIYL
jgi:phage tail P2-like protein